MEKYISYYRVSTGRQDCDMPAQRRAVARCVGDAGVMREYVEVESGADGDRPELSKALEDCRISGAILVVAKLDRLSRSLAFVGRLQEVGGVRFVCADMPNATRETIGIMAVLARWEREQISKRTKEALAEKRKAGVKLGSHNPRIRQGLDKYRESMRFEWARRRRENGFGVKKRVLADNLILPVIRALRSQGISYIGIAEALNEGGLFSRYGRRWNSVQVGRVCRRNGLTLKKRLAA